MNKKDFSWVWWIIVPIVVIGFCVFYSSSSSENNITVKYRDGQVDIANSRWDKLDKSDSDVRNAWYDNDNQYMIIDLNGTYYHYCSMPESAWSSFSNTESSSLDSYYSDNIKGEYDCRNNPIPIY